MTMKISLGAKTIVLPTPVFIIGTYDQEGKPNAMAASWGGICCSRPPCVAVSLREATYTHGNLMEREAFTVSIPSEAHVMEADYFGLASGRDGDKFAAAGLTPVRSELVDAPYVDEFPFFLECRLKQTVEIGSHTQFIGEILDVKTDESFLNDEGRLDAMKVKAFSFDPAGRGYHAVGRFLGKGFSIGREVTEK
jgi:flavin reductase (DIM6/NTAB) family NADH-FMN oxidoreductase RutF